MTSVYEEEEASSSSFPIDEDSNTVSNVITEEMLKEEEELKQRLILERKEKKMKLLEEERHVQEEKSYKCLKLLLNRSSIYAQFLAEKLKRDEIANQKKASKGKKRSMLASVDNNQGGSINDESVEQPKKKSKITVMDIFKKEHMNSSQSLYNTDNKKTDKSVINDVPTISLPILFSSGTLHKYQHDGLAWLIALYVNGVNGILADEMGLGKTVQCIAFIAHLVEMGVPGPFFVCGPLSTLPNWQSEFKRFAPSIPVILYHGTKPHRDELKSKMLKKCVTDVGPCYPVVITSYSICINDEKVLSRISWKLLIVDEAHRLKNFQCQLIKSLKTFCTSHRLLLTGTPLQNNLTELWSLLNFILPEIFDDLKVFETWFDVTRITENGAENEIVTKEKEKNIVSTIHQILTPFLLRRTKVEVNLKLPSKKEVVVYAGLSDIQQKYYTAAISKTIETLLGFQKEEPEVDINRGKPKRKTKPTDFLISKYLAGDCDTSVKENKNSDYMTMDFSKINLNTRNVTMLLRKIVGHPYLVSYPLDHSGDFKIDENLIKNSGKLVVLDALLLELKKRGHKVLIFSQFVTMLEILEDYCYYRKFKYNSLSGKDSLEKRQEQINDFNTSDDSFLFLISTKAGGLGLNLAHADTCIIYDSDWNPQGDLQAQDRCHRIGQTKSVMVYRLIVPNTIDEKILNRANAKRVLERAIIQEGRFSSIDDMVSHKPLSLDDLKELLKSIKCAKFSLLNQTPSPEFIKQLLDRSDMS